MNKWRGHVAYDTLRFDIAMNLRPALGLAMLLLAIIAVGCGESGGVAVEIGEQPPSAVVQPTVEVGDVDPDFARPPGDDGSQLVEVPAAGSYGPLVIYSIRQWLEDKGIEFSELTEPPVLDVSTSALLGSVTIDRELSCVTLVEEGTDATYHLLWPDRTRWNAEEGRIEMPFSDFSVEPIVMLESGDRAFVVGGGVSGLGNVHDFLEDTVSLRCSGQ